ncbi:hypothetical protein, partial [Streptomyces sp. NPDC088141]|uniref:hypothetical protein n=1 Tax=Streptomyces sp. NPDC088141 TaxID=3155179 RepID=UPI003418CFAB
MKHVPHPDTVSSEGARRGRLFACRVRRSGSAVFDKASAHKGKVTAYDSPIYIADAALFLK